MLTRRRLIAGTAALAAGSSTRGFAQSGVEGWPNRPIRVIFPTGAGGPSENFRHYAAYTKGPPGIGPGGLLLTAPELGRAGIEAVHVPYQATTQQLLAAAAGHLQFTFDTVGNARGLVESGKVRALAVPGQGRASVMPDVPSF